jgi:signal transduction histidine kinase
MPLRRDPSKALQLGFLALLLISAVMILWWMFDHARYARSVEQRFAADPTVAADSAARVNRVLWEGGFFLVVLIGGMAVLTRAIRHDAELRRRQQNFLAAVSHEFKSPLASIQLAAETLVLRSREADSQRLGRRMLEDGERLLRMIDNLLDTTRLEEGRQKLAPEPTNVHAAAIAAIAEVAERARLRNIAITLEVPEDLTVNIDPAALATALRNLLDNAVKACIAGKRLQKLNETWVTYCKPQFDGFMCHLSDDTRWHMKSRFCRSPNTTDFPFVLFHGNRFCFHQRMI